MSDALSVLLSLNNSKNKELNQLRQALATLSSSVQNVVLQWLPAHCGIRGNERADTLAREGSQKEQTNMTMSYDEVKTTIKAEQRKKWKLEHPGHNPIDPYYMLSRWEQVKILRLRTGHNRLRHHLHTKLGIGETSECPCGDGPMTTDHILQSCTQQSTLRDKYWPTPTALDTKLHGNLEDLRATAAFIKETGLLI